MPPLSAKLASRPVKMLLVGNSGSGKTGAIGALAQDYTLAFLDFDNGVDILASSVPQANHSKIFVETCIDKYGDNFVPVAATAWPKAINLLVNWKTPEYDLGPVAKWGPDKVLIVDSLTFSGRAAMNHVLSLNGRLGKQPWQSDWGTAIDLQENLLAKLYSDDIKCHVIVTAHLTSVRQDTGQLDEKGQPIMSTVPDQLFPSALGNKLPPKVARYFNTMLRTKIIGNSRQILTVPMDGVDSKSIILKGIPPMLPVSDGLLTYFRKVREAFGQ